MVFGGEQRDLAFVTSCCVMANLEVAAVKPRTVFEGLDSRANSQVIEENCLRPLKFVDPGWLATELLEAEFAYDSRTIHVIAQAERMLTLNSAAPRHSKRLALFC